MIVRNDRYYCKHGKEGTNKCQKTRCPWNSVGIFITMSNFDKWKHKRSKNGWIELPFNMDSARKCEEVFENGSN